MIQLVVFDLDGTLIDSLDDIGNALNLTLATYGIAPMSRADIMAGVGDGVDDLLRAAIGAHPIVLTEFRQRYRQFYHKHMNANGRLYDGVIACLDWIRNQSVALAVLTNKPEAPAKKLLSLFDIDFNFKVIAGPDTYGVHKPHPDGLRAIMAQCQALPECTVMVGDGDTDIKTGRAAGTRTIGVTYGYRSADTLAGLSPDALVDSMADVQRTLQRWCQGF